MSSLNRGHKSKRRKNTGFAANSWQEDRHHSGGVNIQRPRLLMFEINHAGWVFPPAFSHFFTVQLIKTHTHTHTQTSMRGSRDGDTHVGLRYADGKFPPRKNTHGKDGLHLSLPTRPHHSAKVVLYTAPHGRFVSRTNSRDAYVVVWNEWFAPK